MPSADICCGFTVASRQQLLVAATDPTRAAARCRHVGATIALLSDAQLGCDMLKLIVVLETGRMRPVSAPTDLGQHPPFGSWQHGQDVVDNL